MSDSVNATSSFGVSVVGIFFNVQVTVPFISKLSLATLLAITIKQAGNKVLPNVAAFSYLDNDNAATAFSATYSGPFTSKDDRSYPAGEYFLAEDLNTMPAYSVWQYYCFDAAGVYINYNRTPFNHPSVIIPCGGSVIWRQVSVLAGPNSAPPPTARALASKSLLEPAKFAL